MLGNYCIIYLNCGYSRANFNVVRGGLVIDTKRRIAQMKKYLIAPAILMLVGLTACGPNVTANNQPIRQGQEIAYFTNRDGNGEIYVMNTDGSNPTNITHNPATDTNPAWSPDGKQIAFTSDRGGNLDIFVMNADGSHPTNLTNNAAEDGFACWSPDGKRIAFNSYRDGYEGLYTMNADGSNPTNITPVEDKKAGFGLNTGCAFSPDGKQIAFTGSNSSDPAALSVMNIDGSSLTVLAPSSGDPVWSPDGKQLVFATFRDDNPEIYVMNADGGHQTNLTNNGAMDDNPSWSPDGKQIIFNSNRDGNYEIYAMNADGSNLINLTKNSAYDRFPAWSPN